MTRRSFLESSTTGIGAMALALAEKGLLWLALDLWRGGRPAPAGAPGRRLVPAVAANEAGVSACA